MQGYSYCGKHFKVNHAIEEKVNPQQFYMHAHENLELFYFISGNGKFWVEGTPYPLKPHDLLVFNAGEVHHIDISCDEPYERVVIDIDRDFITPENPFYALLDPFFNRPLGEFNIFHSEDFEDGFYKRCLRRIITPSQNEELQIGATLFALLNEMCRVFTGCKSRNTAPHLMSSQILNFVNENIAQNITPDSIAERFFISRSYLYALFRETTGSSVKKYITVKRLLLAKELLSDGTPPSQICSLCGFNDYSSFFRSYKSYFGTSPREDYNH